MVTWGNVWLIPSTQPNATDPRSYHLVTPKGDGPLTLRSHFVDNEDCRNNVTWVSNPPGLVTPDPTNRAIATVPRTAPKRIHVEAKVYGNTFWNVIVWVIWADVTPNQNFIASPDIPVTLKKTTGGSGPGVMRSVGAGFKATIKPTELFNAADRPKIVEQKVVDLPVLTRLRTIVDNRVIKDGNKTRGVSKRWRWDFSRQIQVKVLNPRMYPRFRLPLMRGSVFNGQPALEHIPELFPPATHQGPGVVGNDDGHAGDEHNTPYNAGTLGIMTCTDTPKMSMLHGTGQPNETFEVRLIFNQFVRVLLADQWVRVSDHFPWHTYFRFDKGQTQWTAATNSKEGPGHADW